MARRVGLFRPNDLQTGREGRAARRTCRQTIDINGNEYNSVRQTDRQASSYKKECSGDIDRRIGVTLL